MLIYNLLKRCYSPRVSVKGSVLKVRVSEEVCVFGGGFVICVFGGRFVDLCLEVDM